MIQIKPKQKPNQFIAFLALTKASVIGSLRNPTSLFFSFFFPFIFITIFGILGNGDMKFDIALRDDSLKQGPVYEALKGIDVLTLIEGKKDDEITEDLNKGRLPVAINIQKGVPTNLPNGSSLETYNVSIEISAASPNEVQTILPIINTVVSSINSSTTANLPKLVTTSETVVEGRKFQQIDFILPGQLSFALLTNALFGVAFTFVMYKKELILKRYFATPVKKTSIMASEITSRTIIALLQSIIIITVGHYLFNFTLANGFVTALSMIALSLIGTLVFLSFGLLIPILAKTEDAISPVSNLIMMPQLFLSGAFFPIDAFPSFLQPIAKILPMTFLNEAFKKVAFEGLSITETLPLIGGLLIWGVVIYSIVITFFKWE